MRRLARDSIVALVSVAMVCGYGRAEGSDVGVLTPQEIEYLVTHAPSFNQVAEAGAVLAYGSMMSPPILVTTHGARVLINGVEVFPRQERDPDFRARKLRGRIQEQHYLDKQRKVADPLQSSMKRADELKDRHNARVAFPKRKGRGGREMRWIEVAIGGEKSSAPIDTCPPALGQKEDFILTTLLRQYSLAKGAKGTETARKWLEDRLNERKAGGVLEWYKLAPGDETIETKLHCDPFPTSRAFRESGDRGPEFESLRAASVKAGAKEGERILSSLLSKHLLVFSFGIEKQVPLVDALVDALKSAAQGKEDEKVRAKIRAGLSLEPPELDEIMAELR